MAANNNFTKIITNAIETSNNIDHLDGYQNSGKTALMYAALKGHVEIATKLLIAGADVNLQNNNGRSALLLAIQTNGGTQCVKDIIASPFVEQLCRSDGQHSDPCDSEHVVCHSRDMIKLLLYYGADINQQDSDDMSPIVYACNYYPDCFTLLLESGANANKLANNIGESHLMQVLRYNCKQTLNLVKKLVNHGADVNDKDSDGPSILMYAAHYNVTVSVIKFLLFKGANVNSRNYGISALTIAISSNMTHIVNLLLQNGAKMIFKGLKGCQSLEFAAVMGHIHILQTLITHLFANESRNESRRRECMSYALMAAIYWKHVAIFKFLLNFKSQINGPYIRNNLSDTDINGDANIIEPLIESEANINFRNTLGETPLMLATLNNITHTVRLLLKMGQKQTFNVMQVCLLL